MSAPRRLLLVHAHPDDETLVTGAVMAHYAAAGAEVTLLTCTRGERGEVIGPRQDLATPEAGGTATDGGAALGRWRLGELGRAMAALGVADHRVLGAPGALAPAVVPREYLDSGMRELPSGLAAPAEDAGPGAFSVVPLDEVAGHIAHLIRTLRPHVVVTYDAQGGYGHPDHVRAHEATMRALDLAEAQPSSDATPAWSVPKVYAVVAPRSVVRDGLADAARHVDRTGFEPVDPDALATVVTVPDDAVTAALDCEAEREAKTRALAAHATQVTVRAPYFALSNRRAQRIEAVEYFRLLRGQSAPDASGREHDLFAGLTDDPVPDGDGTASDAPAVRATPGDANEDQPREAAVTGPVERTRTTAPARPAGSRAQDRARPAVRWAARALPWAVAVLGGVGVGILGTVVHQGTWTVGDQSLPVGLALALGLVLAAEVFLASWTRGSGAVIVFGMMIFLLGFVLAQPSGGGSVLVPANSRGYVWLLAPVAVTLGVMFFARRRETGR